MLQKNSVSHPLPWQFPQKCQSAYNKIKSTIRNGTQDILLAAFHSPRGNHSPFSLYDTSDIQRIPWAEWDMHVIPAFGGWHKRSTKSEVSLGFLKIPCHNLKKIEKKLLCFYVTFSGNHELMSLWELLTRKEGVSFLQDHEWPKDSCITEQPTSASAWGKTHKSYVPGASTEL